MKPSSTWKQQAMRLQFLQRPEITAKGSRHVDEIHAMERRISPSKRLKSHSVTLGVEEQLHFRPPRSVGTLLYSSTVLIWNSEVAAIRDIASPTSGLKPCPGLADYCSSTNQSILKYRNDWCGFEVPGKKGGKRGAASYHYCP